MKEREGSANKMRQHEIEDGAQMRQSWDRMNQQQMENDRQLKLEKLKEANDGKRERDDHIRGRLTDERDRLAADKAEREKLAEAYRSENDYYDQLKKKGQEHMINTLKHQIDEKAEFDMRAKLEEEKLMSPPRNLAVCEEGYQCKGCNKKGDHHKYPRNQLSKIKHTKRDPASKAKGNYASSYKDRYLKSVTYHADREV